MSRRRSRHHRQHGPEYGATIGFFPVDEQILTYLRPYRPRRNLIDRSSSTARSRASGGDATASRLFRACFTSTLRTVEPGLAGPRRPQDRVDAAASMQNFQLATAIVAVTYGKSSEALTIQLPQWIGEGGSASRRPRKCRRPCHRMTQPHERSCRCREPTQVSTASTISLRRSTIVKLKHGDVVIAAITSCTNTCNPSVMIAAGLVAKKAVEHSDLRVKPCVKTSLAPGSPSGDRVSQ